ncbi:unnamed protein product, partial [Mesorhabditis spiculigera]
MESPEPDDDRFCVLRRVRKRKLDLQSEIVTLRGELKEVEAELETLSYQDDEGRAKVKLLAQGKKKFNADPEEGLKWMFERNLINPTAIDVAEWLFEAATTSKGVSKRAIGEYLGKHEAFQLEVLNNFCQLHHFADTHVLDALRLFLSSFLLPGESQKIERIIQTFAVHYTESNPMTFKTADSCNSLSYNCIALNTLLHNPNVKDKPTFAVFKLMTDDFLKSGEFNESQLAAIYDSIKEKEFKVPTDSVGSLADGADHTGWLHKQSSKFLSGSLSWKRRWFVLADNCLYYFEATNQKNPKGIIPLQNVGVRRSENQSRPHTFEIHSLNQDERVKACKAESDGRLVEGRHTVYKISASSDEELREWMEYISKAIQTYPISQNGR